MNRMGYTFLGLALLITAGCVSSGSHQQTVAELDQARKASAKTATDFENYKKQSAAKIAALEAEKTQLSNDLLAAQTSSTKIQRELDQTRGNLDSTMASQRDMEADVRKIRAETSGMERLNGELRRERDLLQGKVEDLQKNYDASASRAKDLEQRLSQRDIELGKLTQGSEALAAEKERLEKERAAKEAEIQRLTKTQEDLTKSLQAQIDRGDIKIKQVRDRLTINMVEKVLFNSGQALVKPEGLKVLKQVGDVLTTVNDKQIRIEGHTDNVPIGGKLREKFPTNWELSTARATNVVRYLIDQGGVNRDNVEAVGYADTRPVASNETDAGRTENRRIEIVLFPKDLGSIVGDIKP